MNKKFKFALLAVIVLMFSAIAFAQSPTQIRKKCPNVSVYSQVGITALGDINVQPCTGRSTIFTQNVTLPSGGTVTAGGMTGNPNLAFNATAITSTTTGAQTFRGASHTLTNNAGTAEFNFLIQPSSVSGNLAIGDCVTTPTACLQLSQSSNNFTATTDNFTFGNAGATSIFGLTAVNRFLLNRTITAGGTTGNQTIDKPNGSVNIAAAGTSVVVTNSTVTTSSTVIAIANTNDASCAVKNAVPTANTITITMTAACGAETRVAFWVFN